MLEIERKFIVSDRDSWRSLVRRSDKFVQGYFKSVDATIRIRIIGETAFLTIKSALLHDGVTRYEFEYKIPVGDAEQMLAQFCGRRVIEKTRHQVIYKGSHWEIDEFEKPCTTLIVAEIEMKSADETFDRPPWLGKEVTQDSRYTNESIANNGVPE